MPLRETLATIGPVSFDGLLAYCRMRNGQGEHLPADARSLAKGLRDLKESGFVRKVGDEWEAVPVKAKEESRLFS